MNNSKLLQTVLVVVLLSVSACSYAVSVQFNNKTNDPMQIVVYSAIADSQKIDLASLVDVKVPAAGTTIKKFDNNKCIHTILRWLVTASGEEKYQDQIASLNEDNCGDINIVIDRNGMRKEGNSKK